MKIINYLSSIIFILSFVFAQDKIPIQNITGSGSISLYKDGKVFHYKILESVNKRKKTLKAYVILQKVEEKRLPYKNFTIIEADFQNIKLGTILISLSKIANLNIVFGRELWKSANESFKASRSLKESSSYSLQITTSEQTTTGNITGRRQEKTIPKMEQENISESVSESENYKIPSYLLSNVSLVISSPTPVYTLFNTLLKEYDLIAVKLSSDLIKITKKETLILDVEGVESSSIKKLISKIKQYTSSAARVLYDKDLGKIVVIDTAENIERLKDLKEDLKTFLKTQKVVGKQTVTKVFYFKNRRDLEIALSRLKEKFSDDLVMSVDKDFNAVVITGRKTFVKSAKALISDLVEDVNEPFLTTKIFYVRYVSPYDLKKKIEPLLSEEGEVYIISSGVPQGGGGGFGLRTGVGDKDETKIDAVAPEAAFSGSFDKTRQNYVAFRNALMIRDYPERINQIQEKFKKFLSEKPIKVRIKAKLVEVERNLLRELGISWNTVFSKTYVPEFWQGDVSINSDTSSGGLLTFTFQKNRLNLLELKLKAYEEEGKAKSIAEPFIITVNGEPAVIASGSEYPIVQVQYGETQTTVSTTYENIPLVLITTPIVLPDGNILLDIYLARRQITGIRQIAISPTITQKIPIFSTSRIDVKLPVENGNTLVIGGIIEQSNSNTESGVPGLRKVPLLGWLFKTQTKQLRDRELLIFITPEIIEED